jgi:hypothetical protein
MKAKRYSRILNPYWTESHPDEEPPESEWMKIDVENYWKKVLQMDFESELILEVADHYFWQVMLEHIGLSDEEREVFGKSFFTAKASEGRYRAIHGTIGLNRLSESHLVDASNAIWGSIFRNEETGEDYSKLLEDEYGVWDNARIGHEFVKLIVFRDHKAFKKIAEILKQKPGVTRATSEEKFTPNYAKAWRGFCSYIRDNQKLPTKLAFKRVGGFSKDHRDPNGTKAMKALGLSGLPK